MKKVRVGDPGLPEESKGPIRGVKDPFLILTDGKPVYWYESG